MLNFDSFHPMQLSFYGHSCFQLNTGESRILFDPFISPNPLTEGKVSAESLDVDFMLISHGHGDHVADAVSIAKRTKCTVVSAYEIVTWMEEQGVKNGHPMNLGGSVELPFGRVKYVTAIHSSVLPDGTYAGNPGGFVIEAEGKTIYYAGDTALTLDMKLLAESFKIDWALLPIGDNFTMGVDDAVKAAQFCGASKVIGMHYNTFPYIEIDTDKAKRKFSDAGIDLRLMEIGETIEL